VCALKVSIQKNYKFQAERGGLSLLATPEAEVAGSLEPRNLKLAWAMQ
jgi:hypothetical protein